MRGRRRQRRICCTDAVAREVGDDVVRLLVWDVHVHTVACLYSRHGFTTWVWPTLSVAVGAYGPMVLSGAREADEDVVHRGLCVYICTNDVVHL